MHAPLRIAVLECGTPPPMADSRYSGFGGMFKELLEKSAKKLDQSDHLSPEGGLLDISKWDVVHSQTYPQLENIDAVLLTGSKNDSFEDIPWINRLVEFTQQVLAQDRVRILGTCFGHQIVGRALGAKVGRSDRGWEIAVCDVNLTDKGRELFGQEKIHIQQMHQDVVFDCPLGATVLGSSSLCGVQGLYAPRRFMTVQGHPEFNSDIQTEIIDSWTKDGIFNEIQSHDALSRVNNSHDGVAIGTKFLRFLLEE